MTTPAKMRSAQEWGIDIHRQVTWRMQSKYEGLAHLASAIQSDAIAATEARVRAQVVEECAKVCDEVFDSCSRGSDNWGRTAALECQQLIRALAQAKPVEKQE